MEEFNKPKRVRPTPIHKRDSEFQSKSGKDSRLNITNFQSGKVVIAVNLDKQAGVDLVNDLLFGVDKILHHHKQ